jgi:uncharacterized protein (TIRG00374 family)
LKTSLRIAVTLLLSGLLLVYVVDVSAMLDTLSHCDPWWTLAALLAFTLDRVVMSYKWGLLLEIRGYAVRLTNRLMVYCSAMMWGLALPSTVGADGIRVVLVRRFGVAVNDALASILVERGIGFISALLTGLVGVLILSTVVPHSPIGEYVLLLGALMLVGALALLIFSFTDNALNTLLRLVPKRFHSGRIVQILYKLHDAYRSLASDVPRLAAFSVLTLIEQMMVVVCYWITALALHIEVNAVFMFAAVPLAILISRLPVSIDGIGVYEGIFVGVMALAKVAPEDSLAISLTARVVQIIVWFPWWLALAVRTGTVRPPGTTEQRVRI